MAILPPTFSPPSADGDLFCPPLGIRHSLDASFCGWPMGVDAEENSEEAPWEDDHGYVRFSSAVNQASSTFLYIQKKSISYRDMSEILASLTEGILIRIHANSDPSTWMIFQSTGVPDEFDTFWSIPVENKWSTDASPFTHNQVITVSIEYASAEFIAPEPGTGSGSCCCMDYEFSTSNGDSDPGPGNLRFDNETADAVTEIYVDNVDSGGNGQVPRLVAVGETHDIAGQIQICSKENPDKWHIYNVTGVTIDGTGYQKWQVEWVAGYDDSAEFSTGEDLCVCLVFGQKILLEGSAPGAIQVGASSVALGTVIFSSSNNVNFGLNGSTVTAFAPIRLTNAVSSVLATSLQFSNANNFSFLMSTAASGATLSGSFSETKTFLGGIAAGGSTATSGTVIFSNSNGLAFSLNGQTLTGSYTVPAVVNSGLLNVTDANSSVNASRLVFSNVNGLTLGLSTGASIGTITGSYTVPPVVNSGLLNVTNSVSSVNASRLNFANGGNVVWGLSTNASGATVSATVVASSENIVAAGTQTATAGTVLFADSNGIVFGMSGSSRVTASYTVPSVINSGLLNISDSASSVNASRLAFTNTGNVTFILSTAASGATMAGSVATSLTNIRVSAGASSANLSALTFSNSNNVVFGLNGSIITASVSSSLTAINLSAGSTSTNASAFTFANSNGLAFGLSTGGVITGSYTVPAVINSGLLNVTNTASSVNASRLFFNDGNGVTFGLSTAGSAATITASIEPSAGGVAISASNSSVSNGTVVFSNSNNLSFGLNGSTVTGQPFFLASEVGGNSANVTRFAVSNANGLTLGLSTAGSAATLTGSYTVPAVVNSGLLNITNSASSVNASRLLFSNANNVSWLVSTAGSIATVSASVASSLTAINLSAGTTSSNASAFTFANSNGLAFGLSSGAGAGIITGSYTVPAVVNSGLLNITDSVSSVNASRLLFSNVNGVSFGINTAGSIATVTASVGELLGLVSHLGGNSVADVTRLAFSNASNVTFSLSTAAGAATLLASVNAGGAGGIAASAAGSSQSAGTVVWSNSNGLAFGMNGSTITGSYTVPTVINSGLLQVSNTATSNNVSRLAFLDSNGLTFGFSTGASVGSITASYSVPVVVNSGLHNFSAGASSANVSQLIFTNTNNVGFALSTAAGSVATLRGAASISFSAGTQNNLISNINFADSNGVAFGMNGSTLTASVANSGFLLASHIGGNSANVTRLAFSNASNVTFSLSTAASAATIIASVAAAGGGGVPQPPAGIVLSATNHAIEVITGVAQNTDYTVSYEDNTTTTLTPGSSAGTITTATTTTVQAAPGASTQRTITNVTIVNRGSSTQTITVQKDVAGTNFIIYGPVTIAPGERIEFTSDMGWRKFIATGAETVGTVGFTGDNFEYVARNDEAVDDASEPLTVQPQFNWSHRRVAHHAEFLGGEWEIPIEGFSPGGDIRCFKVSNQTNHPGIIRLVVSDGNTGWLHLNQSSTDVAFDPATILGFRAIIRTIAGSTARVNVGVGDDINGLVSNPLGDNSVLFSIIPAGSLRTITQSGGTETNVVEGITTNNGDWNVYEATYNGSGTWSFYVNNVLIQTSSTNIPSALLNFGIGVFASGADTIVDVDSLTIFTRTLGQRWT